MNNTETILRTNHFPAYVLASAGTGKTEIISRKVEDLIINKGVDIDKIVIITFTNKASAETKERIKKKVYSAWLNGNDKIREQVDKLNMSKISTIHIFCDNIVRAFSYEIGLNPNYKISNLSLEKEKLVNELIRENYDKKVFSIFPMYRVSRLIRNIEEYESEKGLKILLKETKRNNQWDYLREFIYKVYPQYIQRLEDIKCKKGVITTNDLISYAVKILKDKKLSKHIISSFEYLFLDEAQDINFEQAYLVEELIKQGIKVFVVGDEKQSIYGFRGSDKRAFRHLMNFIKEKNGENFVLDINYRSNRFIVDKINNLFSRKFKFKRQTLEFENQPLVPNDRALTGDKSIEIVYKKNIVDIVKNLMQKYSLGDITILCRTNKEVIYNYNLLKEKNLPVQSFISKSIYQSKSIIDIIKLLNYLIGRGILEKEELFYTDFYIANSLKGNRNFYDIMDTLTFTLKSDGILSTIVMVLDEFKMFDYYKSFGEEQEIANIQRLIEIVRDLENGDMTNMEILNYLNIMVKTKQDEPQPQENKKNVITVSTIHTYKGLDNQCIVIDGIDKNLNKATYPDFILNDEGLICFNKDAIISNSNLEPDKFFESQIEQLVKQNIEEELRIMYVMLTRAKDKIVLRSDRSVEQIKYVAKMNKNYISFMSWLYDL